MSLSLNFLATGGVANATLAGVAPTIGPNTTVEFQNGNGMVAAGSALRTGGATGAYTTHGEQYQTVAKHWALALPTNTARRAKMVFVPIAMYPGAEHKIGLALYARAGAAPVLFGVGPQAFWAQGFNVWFQAVDKTMVLAEFYNENGGTNGPKAINALPAELTNGVEYAMFIEVDSSNSTQRGWLYQGTTALWDSGAQPISPQDAALLLSNTGLAVRKMNSFPLIGAAADPNFHVVSVDEGPAVDVPLPTAPTLSISVAMSPTPVTITQGQSVVVTVTAGRIGGTFSAPDITLARTINGAPPTVGDLTLGAFVDGVLGAGETQTTFNLTATTDLAPGVYTVRVNAVPAQAGVASVFADLSVTVLPDLSGGGPVGTATWQAIPVTVRTTQGRKAANRSVQVHVDDPTVALAGLPVVVLDAEGEGVVYVYAVAAGTTTLRLFGEGVLTTKAITVEAAV